MPQARANEIDIEYESFGREGDPLILLIMGLRGAAQLLAGIIVQGSGGQGVPRRQVRQ